VSGDNDGRSERFLLDTMLGKLATYLRMCGYDAADALDRNVEADDDLRRIADQEERTLVTRDTDLAARTDRALGLSARDVETQCEELRAAGVALSLPDRPRRCGRCNGRLESVEDGAETPDHTPDPTAGVWRCGRCNGYFWKGSHWEDVRRRLG